MPRPVQVRRQLGAGDYMIEPPRSAVMVVPAVGGEEEDGADHAGYYSICGTGKARAQSQQQRRSSTTASVPDLFGRGSDGFGSSSSSSSRRGAASVAAAGPRSRPHLVAREEAVHVIQ